MYPVRIRACVYCTFIVLFAFAHSVRDPSIYYNIIYCIPLYRYYYTCSEQVLKILCYVPREFYSLSDFYMYVRDASSVNITILSVPTLHTYIP